MSTFCPTQTTQSAIHEMMQRHEQYRPGSKAVIDSYVESTNAGTGHGKHVAVFHYADGTIERIGSAD